MLIKGIFSGSFDCPLYTGFTVTEILLKVCYQSRSTDYKKCLKVRKMTCRLKINLQVCVRI